MNNSILVSLENVIGSKAIAFKEAKTDGFITYMKKKLSKTEMEPVYVYLQNGRQHPQLKNFI